MPDHGQWLSTAAFAASAGISVQAARKALSRALDGRPWRGRRLAVREVPSRGGRAGIALEVRADCLGNSDALPTPAAPVKTAHAAVLPAPVAPAPLRSGSGLSERYALIEPALRHAPGSPGRRQAVVEAAQIAGRDKATIYRWIAGYEEDGYATFRREARPDRGRRAVFVTRAWDAAVPFDDATKARIAGEVRHYVRRAWRSTTEPGWRWIARIASIELEELTVQAGFEGDASQLRAICKLPHNFVMPERRYRAVAIHEQDAKRWHDEYRPRVRRTRAGRWPMEIVTGDVHPMDVLLPRPDGSTFTAKLVAFEDSATARMFVYPVFLEKGEGVRQEHVAEAFAAMAADPQWGVPQTLYLDNGSEYNCAALVEDAMRRVAQIRALQGDGEPSAARARLIVKALPYNASAKSIESMFSALERGVFSMLPGWIGGNRMAKKTANVGRAPQPYPHGKEAFLEDLQNALIAYETHPQTGQLNGRSPRRAFEEAWEGGWRPIAVSRGAIRAAFARDESRQVRQGSFTYGKGSRRYTARELWGLPAGTRLHLRIPIFGGLGAIPVMNRDGSLLCIAEPERAYDRLDPEGAREAGRRQSAALAELADLRAEIEPLDRRAELARIAEREGEGPVSDGATVAILGNGMEAVGRELERNPAARRAKQDEEDEISTERWREAMDRYLGRTGTDG